MCPASYNCQFVSNNSTHEYELKETLCEKGVKIEQLSKIIVIVRKFITNSSLMNEEKSNGVFPTKVFLSLL